MLDKTLSHARRFIPTRVFGFFQPAYHWSLALLAAIVYRFPSRKIKVIAVTGTKGKSSTVELINAMLEEAGYKTALSNTIRFKVGEISSENLYKMSMPGRFFMQKLLRRAVNAGCQYAVMEMTSQGSLMYRHLWIDLDVFVFTNISPEHIEAHGSFENYVASKVAIAKYMEKSKKKDRVIITNADDKESHRFTDCVVDRKVSYGIRDTDPYEIKKDGVDLTLDGARVSSHLSGMFNLYNILSAAAAVRSQGISHEIIVRAIEKFEGIPGRVQKIEASSEFMKQPTVGKQDFTVIVDYAHTADSLEKLYQVFQSSRNICVLGGTGGGRDTAKRAIMGKIADTYCDEIIITDEDPYDENPERIVKHVADGIETQEPTIIMDRRAAIAEAIKRAKTGDTILITGKGTDPYIMGARGSKVEWSDAKVAQEEIEKSLRTR